LEVLKTMVWLNNSADFPGFNAVYDEHFPDEPPTRSAVVNDLLVNVRVEVEVVSFKPLSGCRIKKSVPDGRGYEKRGDGPVFLISGIT